MEMRSLQLLIFNEEFTLSLNTIHQLTLIALAVHCPNVMRCIKPDILLINCESSTRVDYNPCLLFLLIGWSLGYKTPNLWLKIGDKFAILLQSMVVKIITFIY